MHQSPSSTKHLKRNTKGSISNWLAFSKLRTTEMTTTHDEVLFAIKEKEFIRYPPFIKTIQTQETLINVVSFITTTIIRLYNVMFRKGDWNIDTHVLTSTIYKERNATQINRERFCNVSNKIFTARFPCLR